MAVVIRPMGEGDLESIVALSLRAWAPVFDSIHETVGSPIFGYFYGEDWRTHQAEDVRRACSAYEVLVADDDGRVTGFTAIDLPADGVEGEIYMLAVDPEALCRIELTFADAGIFHDAVARALLGLIDMQERERRRRGQRR